MLGEISTKPHLRVVETAPASRRTALAGRKNRTCGSQKPHLRVAYIEQERQEVFRRLFLGGDTQESAARKTRKTPEPAVQSSEIRKSPYGFGNGRWKYKMEGEKRSY